MELTVILGLISCSSWLRDRTCCSAVAELSSMGWNAVSCEGDAATATCIVKMVVSETNPVKQDNQCRVSVVCDLKCVRFPSFSMFFVSVFMEQRIRNKNRAKHRF